MPLFLPGLLETLAPLGLRTLVVGRAGDDPRFVPDDFPGAGPLGGLATALRHAGGAPVLALACDLPHLTADAARWLLSRWPTTPENMRGLVVRHAETGRLEPLFSIYAPSCLDDARERLASGRRSLHGLIEGGAFAFIDLPEELAPCLHNVNRPEDL